MRFRLLQSLLILSLAAGAVRAQDGEVSRYVEFRDGSVLKLPVVDQEWKVFVLSSEGQIEEQKIRLSTLDQLTLTPEGDLQKKNNLLKAIRQLGDEDFQQREKAHAELLKLGPAVRPDLELFLELAGDKEIVYRLKAIIGKLPADPNKGAARMGFDLLFLKDKEPLRGDVGEGTITVKVDGAVRKLSRKDVRGFSQQPPEMVSLSTPKPGVPPFRRISAEQFPENCTEESFETGPDGNPLSPGDNIEKYFIKKGFLLSTSIGTSFVSVNNYTVQGKSKGQSIATHSPLFEGEITIRFVKPGQEYIPASVTHFGFWIGKAAAHGVTVFGYDMRGRELGQVQPQRGENEFIGIRSTMPIHQIRIVPNAGVSKEYTLDDFIFTEPQAVEPVHPDKFAVRFTDGDHVMCDDISFAGEKVHLHGLPAGLPDRTRALADLIRIATPMKGWKDHSAAQGIFVELTDGSVIFGAAPQQGKHGSPAFVRQKDILKKKSDIAGLWSTGFKRLSEVAKIQDAVVWDTDQNEWQPISNVKLLEEIVMWTVDEEKKDAASYRRLPPLWLKKPSAEPAPGTWQVLTSWGETLSLTGASPFSGKLSKALNFTWRSEATALTPAELLAIVRVPKKP
jgi:hypothetical protein